MVMVVSVLLNSERLLSMVTSWSKLCGSVPLMTERYCNQKTPSGTDLIHAPIPGHIILMACFISVWYLQTN